MVGQKILDYIFNKKNQAVTLEAKPSVHTDTEAVLLDPPLLFQCLVTADSRSGDLHEVFTYEFFSYSPGLFKISYLLLPTTE